MRYCSRFDRPNCRCATIRSTSYSSSPSIRSGGFKWDASSQTCSRRWNCAGGGPFWLATLLSARMASARFLVIVCTRDSTRALWVCNTLSELSVGLYPKRIWLGESPVVVLIRLLCTVVASASQCVHPFGLFDVTNRRYCSIH